MGGPGASVEEHPDRRAGGAVPGRPHDPHDVKGAYHRSTVSVCCAPMVEACTCTWSHAGQWLLLSECMGHRSVGMQMYWVICSQWLVLSACVGCRGVGVHAYKVICGQWLSLSLALALSMTLRLLLLRSSHVGGRVLLAVRSRIGSPSRTSPASRSTCTRRRS